MVIYSCVILQLDLMKAMLSFSIDDDEGDGRAVSLERILVGEPKSFLGHGRWGTMHAGFEADLCSLELACYQVII